MGDFNLDDYEIKPDDFNLDDYEIKDAAPAGSFDAQLNAIAAKHNVSKDTLRNYAQNIGFYPQEEAEVNLAKGNLGQHVLDAAQSTAGTAGEGLMLGLPAYLQKKFSSPDEARAMDEVRAEVDRRKTWRDTATELALAPVAVTKGMGKIGSAATNIGMAAGAGLAHTNEGEGLAGAKNGAAIAAAFEALPVVGQGIKAAKKFVPGTATASPKVNRLVANLAADVPWQEATADDIYRYLSNVNTRRKLMTTNVLEETNKLLPEIDAMQEKLGKAVSSAYDDGVREFLVEGSGHIDNTKAAMDFVRKLDDNVKLVNDAEKKTFFSANTRKITDNVKKILTHGGPDDVAGPLVKNYSDDLLKQRFVEARRHIDDLMKNKDWDRLNNFDREYILGLRQAINDPLHSKFTGSDALKRVDQFYTDYQDKVGKFFGGMQKRGQDGTNLSKLYNDVNSHGARGLEFDQGLDQAAEWVNSNASRLGAAADETKGVVKQINDIRELGDFQALKNYLNQSGGGPSNRIINGVAQVVGMLSTSGKTLLALPVTSPTAYVNLIDKLSVAGGNMGKYSRILAEAQARGGNALAVTHFLLSGQDPEYAAAINGVNE